MKPHLIKARSRRRVLAGPSPQSGSVAAPWLLIFFVATSASMSCDAQETREPSAPTSSQVAEPRSEESLAPSAPRSNAEPSGAPTARAWTFDDDAVGTLPEGWLAPVGEWGVESAEQAPSGSHVLAQEASNRSPVFNVALVEGSSHADVDLTVRLRARQGRIDQGGGVVWRARNARNYYIARYNPLEDNYRVYYVEDGRRRQLDSANVRLDHEAWHTLRVRMVGDHIECFLNGEKHLDVRDATFTEAGMVGLWTKADAQTRFDDLAVQGLDRGVLDAQAIGRTLGVEAKTTDDGVVRATWSRTEVPVTIDGMSFPAAAGLTSWAGFTSTEGGAMLMGDTVVFQDEVSPAMDAAFANDLEITALHNHFFYDEPKVYFMHIGGHGDPNALARGVDAVWDAIREVRRRRPEPASTFAGDAPSPGGALDAAAIGRIVGVEPTVNDGVVKVTIGHEAAMHGTRVSGSMGLTSWAAFTGSDELAAIDGDFAMTASEVQPVLRALRNAGIHVVALHNHMIGEEPAYFFTHFWAKGPAAELARGFRAAFDAQQEAGGNDGR